ncbi:MAG: HAD-IA family hydrolase [Gemmatimonadota bacterium]
MPRPRSVVFDFDYTLADSSRGVCACMEHALRVLGLPAVSPASAVRTIGLSLPVAFRSLLPHADPALAPEFTRLFLEKADEVMVDGTRLYPSVPGTVAALREAGLGLAIVSTKYRLRIEAILARDGLAGAFDVIVGGEDVPVHKPDPTGLLRAVDRLGSGPSTAVYIGDSTVDAETAQRAGVPFVATLTGTTARADFAPFPVQAFVDEVGQLPVLLLN